MLSSKTVSSFEIEKDSESYNATRYNRADGNYSIVDDDGNKFVFKIMVQQGIRTAFIVDVFCKSSANFCSAIKHIIRDKKNNFDLILYVGDIPFKHFGMICIPKKYEPKEFNFTGSVLDNKAISKETFFCQSKWDVNLSNYDLL